MEKKFKLNSGKLSRVLSKVILHQLNHRMDDAMRKGRKCFEVSFELKNCITERLLFGNTLKEIHNEIANNETLKDIYTVCKSRNWDMQLMMTGGDKENLLLSLKIGKW